MFVNELITLTNKTVCREYLEYIWKRKFDWDEDKAKKWLVENKDFLKEMENKWKEERYFRMNIINRYNYDETVPKHIKPYESEGTQSKTRYLENTIVSNKGEKYIVQKQGEEWDGGSRGKVKTKGKRGKGFI